MNHARWTLIALPILALGMLGLSQPQGSPQERPSRERGEMPEGERPPKGQGRLGVELRLDPEALRIRLEQMVQRGQEMAQRGQAAIDKLDSGASASDVLAELNPTDSDRRPRIQPRPQEQDTRRPGPRDGMPPNGGPNGTPKTNKPQVDNNAIQEFLIAEFPDLWKNFEPLISADPKNADRLLGRMAPQIREIIALRDSDPVLASIKTDQMRAGLGYVEAARIYRVVISNPDSTQQERDSAMTEIRLHAENRFDADIRAKQHEIDRLEAHLDSLRGSVSDLESTRDEKVEKMVADADRNAKRLARKQAERKNNQKSGSGDD